MILFVGDHTCFSDIYLRLIREEFPHFRIVCERRMEDAERRVQVSGEDITFVVICCRFGEDALKALKRFVDMAPNISPVLAYASLSEVHSVFQSVKDYTPIDRLSFLPMRAKIDSVISIFHLLISGECHVSNEVVKLLLEKSEDSGQATPAGCPVGGIEACPVLHPINGVPRIDGLTARELEVLQLLSEGAPNKVIAETLSLSPSTVKLHIHHIIAKLDVRNRTEAAVAYLSSKLSRQRDPVS